MPNAKHSKFSKKTNHFMTRMSQRGINQALVDLALAHGEHSGDRIMLGHKQLHEIKARLDVERASIMKALDKGGVVVVQSDGVLITTFGWEA